MASTRTHAGAGAGEKGPVGDPEATPSQLTPDKTVAAAYANLQYLKLALAVLCKAIDNISTVPKTLGLRLSHPKIKPEHIDQPVPIFVMGSTNTGSTWLVLGCGVSNTPVCSHRTVPRR